MNRPLKIRETFNGRAYVRAHAHEPNAVAWQGEVWRPLEPCAGHVEDNQGLCHRCGETLNLDRWYAYAGDETIPPTPVAIHYAG